MEKLMGKPMTVPPAEREIADLVLASFLSSLKHQIIRIEPRNGRSFFIFKFTPQLQRDEIRFFNREGSVEPLTFAETLRYFRAAVR